MTDLQTTGLTIIEIWGAIVWALNLVDICFDLSQNKKVQDIHSFIFSFPLFIGLALILLG